jgi:acetate kinase
VDVIILTAGVMEHRAIVRKMLLEKLSWLGITLDIKSNQDEISSMTCISTPDSKVAVIVIPTDEELMIAKQTFKLVNN